MPNLEKANGAIDGAKRISTAEAARMLAVTKDAVRYMVSRGELVPIVAGGQGGQAWFDRGDVIALAAKRAKRRPGKLTQGAVEAAAMVHFEMHLRAGTLARCVPDVVIATLLPATEVQRLRAIFAHERAVAIPRPAPMPLPAEEHEARDARANDTARDSFESEMAARRRELDREPARDDDDEDDDRPRRKRR